MLRTSLPPTPRDVVESITSVVRPNRWAFEKCMELLLSLRRRPPESDYSGRRADTPDERHIRRLLGEIRASLPALSAAELVGARTHLEAAFEHCQNDKMGKASVEFARARQMALDASGCLPEPEEPPEVIDGGSRRDTQVVEDLEGRVEAIRIACVSALYENDQNLEEARDLVSRYVTWLLRSPAIRGQFEVYLNPAQPRHDAMAGFCADRKRLLAGVCLTNLVLQSFFMKLGMADSLEDWPTIGLRHMKHFYI